MQWYVLCYINIFINISAIRGRRFRRPYRKIGVISMSTNSWKMFAEFKKQVQLLGGGRGKLSHFIIIYWKKKKTNVKGLKFIE